MKRYIKHLIILAITIASVIPNAFAEVDVARSFYILRNDSAANGFVEGGEWLIEFSNKDTLGYEYDYPVAMNFKGAYYGDSTFIPMQSVDSVQFEQPSTIMKPGVFELTEEHYQYIVDTDMFKVIRFRIDCIAKIELPKVGQKVISYIYKTPLPFGFLGEVESIKVSYDEGCIVMTCKRVPLSAVYDRLYVSEVVGNTEVETDSIPNGDSSVKNKTYSRRLDPKYDTNDDVTKVPIVNIGIPDVGLYYNKSAGTLLPTYTPKTQSSPFVIYATNSSITGNIVHATVIDKNGNKDYTEFYASFKSAIDLGFRVDRIDGMINPKPLKESFAPLNVLITNVADPSKPGRGWTFPIASAPGTFLILDAGLSASVAFDAQLTFEYKPRSEIKAGVKINGSTPTPIFEGTTDPKTFPDPIFGVTASASMTLKGGLYFDVKFGLPLELAEVTLELLLGPRFTSKIGSDALSVDETLKASTSWIENRKRALKKFNELNGLKFDLGLDYDGYVRLIDGIAYEGSWIGWLESRGVPHADMMYDLWSVEGAPKYKYYEETNDKDLFSGRFKAETGSLYNHSLGLMFKDSYLPDEAEEYVHTFSINDKIEKSFDPGLSKTFSIQSTDPQCKILKGKPLDVYPYMNVDDLGYVALDKIAHIEFPYESKVIGYSGNGYDEIVAMVEVDPEVMSDPDYTKSGVLVWEESSGEQYGQNYFGNETMATDCYVSIKRSYFDVFGIDPFSDISLTLNPFVYDNKRKRYVYGDRTYAKFKGIADPKTENATDISYNSACLNGTIFEEFFKYYNGLFKVVFSYWIPGKTTETILKYDSSDYPDIYENHKFNVLIADLQANTEYEYRVGIELSNGKFYGGEPVKFKTKTPISNLRHEAGSDFAILYADLPTDYIAKNCKEIYFEVVEIDKNFAFAIAKVADEGDFVINEDGTTTIDVIFYDLIPSLEYKYRLVFVDDKDNKIYSNFETFTTDATALKAITKGAAVKGNVVVLKGNLSLDLVRLLESQGIKKVYFGYSKLSDMRNKVTVEADFVDTYSTVTLSDLSYGSTYYYYFYAIDADNNVYEGDVLSFVTDASPLNTPETCFTLEADVNDANVTMMGGVPPLQLPSIVTGFYRNIQYGFEVAEKQSDLTGKTPTFATDVIDKETGIFTITKILQPNTTYYIRAMVFYNDKWVAAPEVVSVKTADFDPNLKPPEIGKQ